MAALVYIANSRLEGTINSLHNERTLYSICSTRVMKLYSHPGFGVRTLSAAAALTYREQGLYNLDFRDFKIGRSLSWCYWYIKVIMKMSLRKITGEGDQGGSMTAKQQELWSILLMTLACDVQDLI